MAAVACNSLAGQLALSFSQPSLKSPFYPEIYSVKEETDTNSNHVQKLKIDPTIKQKTASLQRGNVRFEQSATMDLSRTSDLSNSKDSGIGSSDDQQSNQGENAIPRHCVDNARGDETEDDEEYVRFTERAKKFIDVDVGKMTWKERGERMDNCLGWLREEITKMKKQDQTLMRQFMELRSTIHQLKRSNSQQSLRATYLRNQLSCANLGACEQSARSGQATNQSRSPTRNSLHPLSSTSQSSQSTNLLSQQVSSRSNLNHMHAMSRLNSSSHYKISNCLVQVDDASFDMDTYFCDVDFENDSFFEDDDSDTFVDQPMGIGGDSVSALSEQPYMPQYRTRTVSLVTPHYIGRQTASGYLARSRYMSFTTAKGQIESERAILE